MCLLSLCLLSMPLFHYRFSMHVRALLTISFSLLAMSLAFLFIALSYYFFYCLFCFHLPGLLSCMHPLIALCCLPILIASIIHRSLAATAISSKCASTLLTLYHYQSHCFLLFNYKHTFSYCWKIKLVVILWYKKCSI
jgi:hypothetical protein